MSCLPRSTKKHAVDEFLKYYGDIGYNQRHYGKNNCQKGCEATLPVSMSKTAPNAYLYYDGDFVSYNQRHNGKNICQKKREIPLPVPTFITVKEPAVDYDLDASDGESEISDDQFKNIGEVSECATKTA